MKLTQTSPDKLELTHSATGTVIFGAVFIFGGIAGAIISPLMDAPWWYALISAGLAAIGGLVVYGASSRTLKLSAAGENLIVTKRVITGKEDRVTFSAEDVASVRLNIENKTETTRDSDGDTDVHRYRVGTIFITLANGSQIDVMSEREGAKGGMSLNGIRLGGLTKAPLADEAEMIAKLYGRQLQTHTAGAMGLADIPNVVSAIKENFAKNTTAAPASTAPQDSAQPATNPPSQEQ